jgi:hypothetical protein
VRTTLSLDDDVANLLQKENRRAGEPMKQTVNRLLRSGLAQAASPRPKPKRFIVKPFHTGITSEQWKSWGETKIEEILEQTEMPSAQ